MQGAIAEGLYSSNTRPVFNCSTNCVWSGTYTTLGFDSECRDVTAATLATRKCTDLNGKAASFNPASGFSVICNMTTPSNITLGQRYIATMSQTILGISSRTLYPQGYFWSFSEAQDPVTKLYPPQFLKAAQYKTTPVVDNKLQPEEVIECTASLVGLKYSDVTATGNQITIGKTEVFQLKQGLPRELYGSSYQTTMSFNGTNLPPFNIGSVLLVSLSEFLHLQLFNQSVELGDEAATQVGVNVPLSQADGGLPAVLKRVLQRMTDRVATGPNMQVANGETLGLEIFVHVSWYWLALPVAIELVATIFLILTIWNTREATGRILWKYSALAMLFHYTRVPEDPNEVGGLLRCDVRSPEELQSMSEGWTVRVG